MQELFHEGSNDFCHNFDDQVGGGLCSSSAFLALGSLVLQFLRFNAAAFSSSTQWNVFWGKTLWAVMGCEHSRTDHSHSAPLLRGRTADTTTTTTSTTTISFWLGGFQSIKAIVHCRFAMHIE